MFGVGAVTNFFVRRRKYKKELEQIDAVIVRLEGENAKPLLNGFSGIDLVDSTIVLLDATLDKRIKEVKGTKKLQWIKLYLERIEEVYSMNKDTLEDIPATRKEIVALGLAIRHMAVALDQEFASLNELKALVNNEVKNVQAVTAEYEKSFQRFQSQINNEIANIRSDCDRRLELQKKVQGTTRVLAYVGIAVGLFAGLVDILWFFNLLQ